MQRVLWLARRAARFDSTVLITGESGVGKEWLARLVHQGSRRATAAFVPVNCAALAESLADSELFGHVRGAFTGAVADRPGLFDMAAGGTLFLDEVGEMSPVVQAKVLRAIQEREVRRVGATTNRSIDFRLIAATNRNLLEDVQRERFRRDLYYRLHVIELRIPPLRDRLEDLPQLARDLLRTTAARVGARVEGFSGGAFEMLLRYPWPGNIRELEHAIEYACVTAETSEIDVGDLPESMARLSAGPPVHANRLTEHRLTYVRAVLARHAGHRRRTAHELGISLSTLKRWLRHARA
jgi:transcriptional regulator with PAS, ATPase and Fis domain